jgi:putative membrane protein
VAHARWPGWVYGSGEEPDYRFSFANERTFLAWVRTALAMLAGGVGLAAIGPVMSGGWQHGLSVALVALGVLSVLAAWLRWAVAERAVRRGVPLPGVGFGLAIAVVVAGVGIAILATLE